MSIWVDADCSCVPPVEVRLYCPRNLFWICDAGHLTHFGVESKDIEAWFKARYPGCRTVPFVGRVSIRR